MRPQANSQPRAAGQRGFTLLEMLIAIAISLIVLAAASRVVVQSMQSTTVIMTRSEMQNELRSASNQIARDLQQAGTGVPIGGVPIPSAASGGTNPKFGCDLSTCYLTANNLFTQGVLYKVTPGSAAGPTTTTTTDAICPGLYRPQPGLDHLCHADAGE